MLRTTWRAIFKRTYQRRRCPSVVTSVAVVTIARRRGLERGCEEGVKAPARGSSGGGSGVENSGGAGAAGPK